MLRPPQPRVLSRSARRTCVRPSAARAAPESASFTAAPSADAATVKDRAKAGLLGAVLADVATMPLHWHYDKGEILRKLRKEPNGPLQALTGLLFADKSPLDLDALAPEFFEPPGNMFYTYAPGTLSPYGAEAAGLVRSVAKHGALVPEKYAEESAAEFRAYPGRLNSISKTYLAQWDAGARWPSCGVAGDTQAHCLVRVPCIVARYAGKPELRTAVADAVSVHQAHPAPGDYALAYAALLERIVLGASLADALKWAAFDKANPLYDEQRKMAQDALAELGNDSRDIVSKYGVSCSLPGPFVGPLAIVFGASGDFTAAVRANIVAGGDSCSRAAVVGGLCGAAGGMAALPPAWRAKVNDWQELEAAADAIVAAAGYA